MNRRITRFFLLLFAAAALAMPALAAPPNWPDLVDAMVIKARNGIPTVDMAGYLKVVQNPNGAMLLDVREGDEFATGHVPGAIDIPRGFLEFRIWKAAGYPDKVDFNRTIYVQCLTGGRASFAAQTLKKLGFKHPVVVLMDFREWVKAGNPTVTEGAK